MTTETTSLYAMPNGADRRGGTFVSAMLRHFRRRRAYTDLLQLDDYLLRDIGLTRADLRPRILTRSAPSRTAP